MGLFSKKQNAPTVLPPEPLPVISDTDLADAERIMNRWDASMGNSDAMWDCLEAIGRRGGYRGAEGMLHESLNGRDITEILQRPWRWWNEAARAANSRGQDALVGRIFLFAYLYVNQLAPTMKGGNELSTGVVKPAENLYKDIAALAVDSLAKHDRSLLIHNTATGRVDVASAIGMAEQASGVTAPPSTPSESSATPLNSTDGSQWNTL